eukprot:gb/GFBE01016803.1/.p1 GENE.gb/GFBE01016803.1/~~gb/GFBE01016803.1/.p1  ORF type:complete len:352 (+),score=100.66 gb/GFBE01016803.1/:1-1056(+)
MAAEFAADAAEASDEEEATASAAELKAHGNEAYSRGDCQAAVDLWNRAIRQHVEAMKLGEGPSCLSEESRQLERSIYLNLAQGYLKLDDAGKALRACQVVMHDHPGEAKAIFRAAEACLKLKRFEEGEKLLRPLLEAEPPMPEAVKLRLRLRAGKKEEADAAKKLAKRMSAGTSGFSDDKPPPAAAAQPSRAGIPSPPMADLGTVTNGTDVAAEAAQAALRREQRMAAAASGETPLPVPAVNDLESFMAKAMGRSQKYAAAAAKSRKQTEAAQRSVRLDWLRSGQDREGLANFVSPLQAELREIEEATSKAAKDEEEAAEEDLDEDAEPPTASAEESAPGAGGVSTMEEMD